MSSCSAYVIVIKEVCCIVHADVAVTAKEKNPFAILVLALFDVDFQHYLAVNKRARRKSNL